MKISSDKIVTFHYRLSDEEGVLLEESHGGDPTAYLHGHRNVIRGLEDAMEGKSIGDVFTATIEPIMAYGLRREDSHQRVPIKHLLTKAKAKVKPGMTVSVQTEQGVKEMVVIKAGKFNVDLDTNHPLAGKTLTFEISILDIRESTSEERSHGHAHGVGGHHH